MQFNYQFFNTENKLHSILVKRVERNAMLPTYLLNDLLTFVYDVVKIIFISCNVFIGRLLLSFKTYDILMLQIFIHTSVFKHN